METYQRSQALVLLDDMASRISVNRGVAASYVTATAIGSGMSCPTAVATTQEVDRAQWCNALQGAAEMQGAGKVGAMLGARGCVESLPNNEYMVTVAWQGLTPISAPPASVTCGSDQYDGTSEDACDGDRCRRVVTTIVRIATLN
jgi:type IV pilus assembly protein PilV